jgi:hypothetical protein
MLIRGTGLLASVAGTMLAFGVAMPPTDALAFAITNTSTGTTGQGAFIADDSGSSRSWFETAVSSSGPVNPGSEFAGAIATFSVRYAATLAADYDGEEGSVGPLERTGRYQVLFRIEDPNNIGYTLEIATNWAGALTISDDGPGSGVADIDAVTGTIMIDAGAAVTQATLGLADVSSVTSSATSNTSFSGSNLYSVALVGTHDFVLNFSWNMGAVTSNDIEAAVRLGLPCGITTNHVACDYPGAGSRTQANDGHFTAIKATLNAVPQQIPAPATLGLLGLALVGMGLVRRKI